MAEVGLVRFAQVAFNVAKTTVPPYRTHQFKQPQLLAILCLMGCEDWTYREAEVRLSEHSELWRALELRSVPDYTTLYRFPAPSRWISIVSSCWRRKAHADPT